MKYYCFLIIFIISCENIKKVDSFDIKESFEEYLVYEDLLTEYKTSLKQVIFDTLHINSNNKVISKLYYTFDSAYLMPKEFIWDSTINQFFVYNREIELKYFRNNKLKFDTIIDKYYLKEGFNKRQLNYDFRYLMISNLYFTQKDSLVILNINMNIPITDIGYLKEIKLNKLIGF